MVKTIWKSLGGVCLLKTLFFGLAPIGWAQTMKIALSNLRIRGPSEECRATFCPDNEAWASLVHELGGIVLPSVLVPARTKGPQAFEWGLEGGIVGIQAHAPHWQLATSKKIGEFNRFDPPFLGTIAFSFRKGLPFGFELGAKGAYLISTALFLGGADLRLSILEGWLGRNGPEIAFRGSHSRLFGDADFQLSTWSAEAIISASFVIESLLELSPWLSLQLAWVFAESALVDLTPDIDAWSTCMPNLGEELPPTPRCEGEGIDLLNQAKFRSIAAFRPRAFLGTEVRHKEWASAFSFALDILEAHEIDSLLPRSLSRQWRIDCALRLIYP
ncbi:MAG: hypothetical protein N2515_01810 [Deltaproteobacteria bacterium]|nr:hypothetical protein [Deltaproteobacteria bacterium]